PSPAPAANKVEPAKEAAAPSLKRPRTLRKAATLPDGDLPPGIDGGSTDADVAFFLRRQPVFYRSTHPVGSTCIDKQQRLLYFIQPHQVALRYGIGVGKSCAGIAGLHKVADKKEWPEWQAPADMIERKLAPAGVMKGGSGNPLGARILVLDDGSLSIHGTNAPATIGSSVDFGCIRLANDDAVDLSNRVAIGARVIFSDSLPASSAISRHAGQSGRMRQAEGASGVCSCRRRSPIARLASREKSSPESAMPSAIASPSMTNCSAEDNPSICSICPS